MPSTPPPKPPLEPSVSTGPAREDDAARSSVSESSTPKQPVLVELSLAALVLLFVGASVALGIALFFYDDLPGLVGKNAMPSVVRNRMIAAMLAGSLALPLAAGIYLLIKRTASAVRRVARWAKVLSPLVLSFVVPFFFDWKVFHGNELLLVSSATIFGFCLERTLRVSFKYAPIAVPGSAGRLSSFAARWPRLGRSLPFGLTCTLALAFGLYFSYYTILHHWRLQTSSWDLAIFDNLMWNLLRGHWFKASPDLGPTGSHIQFHATFLAYLFTPIYALYQRAETLLAIQAVIVGAAAVPIYLLGKLRTGSAWAALLLSFAYVIHAPLHGPVFYDFHFLTLSPFFISWVLYLFETGRRSGLVVMWLAALLLREDQGACMAMAALFFLMSGKRPAWALLGGVISAAYFVAMKFVVMPLHRNSPDAQTFTWIFGGLLPEGEIGFGGVLKTIFTSPLFTLNSILDSEKLTYILKTFGPLIFLPLRQARTWLLFVPAAIFTLLSSGYKPLYQSYFQYTSNWTAYLFFAAAVVLGTIRKGPDGTIRFRAACVAVLLTSVIFSYNQGGVLGRENFRGGFRKVEFTMNDLDRKRLDDLRSLIAKIPRDASVAATELEAPHLSNRENCYTLRFGALDADFILARRAEISRGLSRKTFRQAIDSGQYGFVAHQGEFVLWQRGAPQTDNARGRRLSGIEAAKRSRAARRPAQKPATPNRPRPGQQPSQAKPSAPKPALSAKPSGAQ